VRLAAASGGVHLFAQALDLFLQVQFFQFQLLDLQIIHAGVGHHVGDAVFQLLMPVLQFADVSFQRHDVKSSLVFVVADCRNSLPHGGGIVDVAQKRIPPACLVDRGRGGSHL